jgi:hypothetical protein
MLQPYTCHAEVEFHSQGYLCEYKLSSHPVNTNMFYDIYLYANCSLHCAAFELAC